MRDSCTRHDQQTRCSDWGKKEKKKAPVKSQWLHQSASSSTLFLLHGFLAILSAMKQAMRLASQYTGPPAYSGGKHQGIVSYDGEDRLLLPTGIYNLQAQLHSKWGPKTTAIRRQRQEKRTSAVFGWGVKGRDRIRVNDFEAGWLWPAMAPDSIRGSRQREVLCLIWPSFSASSTMTDVFKWLFLWQMLNANYS